VGLIAGKIKFMRDHRGTEIHEAGPGIPVEIIGLKQLPVPGTTMFCVDSKEEAEQVVEFRQQKLSQSVTSAHREYQKKEEEELKKKAMDLLTTEKGANNFDRIHLQEKIGQLKKESDMKKHTTSSISIVLKTDVAGSIEGVQKALSVLPQDEVGLEIVKAAVGPITEGDVAMAKTSGSYLVGFNVKANPVIAELARKREVPIIEHKVVYQIVSALSDLMSELLPPRIVVDVSGTAQVRELFEINKGTKSASTVAGCLVTDGLIKRGSQAQVVRGDEVVHTGKIDSLRSFRQAVADVRKGNDCGLGFPDFNEYRIGDIVRCIAQRQIPRKLGDPK